MPIYEYRCLICGKISEFLVTSDNKEQDITCKYCGSSDVIRVLSATSYTMKENVSVGERSNCRREKPCCGAENRCHTPPCKS